MTYGSLFSGIGTADYGARLLGWPVVFTCDNEPYCQASLRKNTVAQIILRSILQNVIRILI